MLIEGGYAYSLKMLLDRSRAEQLRSAGCSLRLPVEPLERKAHLRARRIIVAALVLCCLTVFLASLAIIYLGDHYVTPALSEQRVPPTRSY